MALRLARWNVGTLGRSQVGTFAPLGLQIGSWRLQIRKPRVGDGQEAAVQIGSSAITFVHSSASLAPQISKSSSLATLTLTFCDI